MIIWPLGHRSYRGQGHFKSSKHFTVTLNSSSVRQLLFDPSLTPLTYRIAPRLGSDSLIASRLTFHPARSSKPLFIQSVCVISARKDKPLLIQHCYTCLEANRVVLYEQRFVIACNRQIVSCSSCYKTCKFIPEFEHAVIVCLIVYLLDCFPHE